MFTVVAPNGEAVGVGGAVGAPVGTTDGAGAIEGAGVGADAAIGPASTSDVRMKIGEPRYQPTGNMIASSETATTAVRHGWRRAAEPAKPIGHDDGEDRQADRADRHRDPELVQRTSDVVGEIADRKHGTHRGDPA
jgi:hypothetical protein